MRMKILNTKKNDMKKGCATLLIFILEQQLSCTPLGFYECLGKKALFWHTHTKVLQKKFLKRR